MLIHKEVLKTFDLNELDRRKSKKVESDTESESER